MNISELNVVIGAEISDLDRGLKQASSSVRGFEGDVKRTSGSVERGTSDMGKGFNSLGNIAKGVGVAMVAAFSVDALLNIGREIINTTANFQKMEAVLTNTLGSQSAAQNAMLMIQDIAAKTPFSVEQLSESFVKLANRGIKPTSDEIIKLGDLAASTGKDFDQLTEAMLDALTGEFERLKEFGVTAKAQGDKVAFTFKGVTTEVQKTDSAIKAYVLSLGEAEGVSGAMAGISGTLGGRISNLGDTFTNLFKTIGDGTSGPLNFFVGALADLVEGARKAIASNEQLAKEGASKAVSSYAEALATEFKALSAQAKEAGWDVQAALDSAFDAKKTPLEQALQNITKEIARVQGQLNSPAIANNAFMSGDLNKELVKLLTAYETVNGKLNTLKETYNSVGQAAKNATSEQVAAFGILTNLQKDLSNLKEDQLTATSAGEIEGINAQIAAKEAEIQKYQELGDAQRNQQKVLQDLNEELSLNKLYAEALGKSYDYVGQRIGTLDGGIKELIQAGFKPGSAAVQNFRAELEMLKAFDSREGIDLLADSFTRVTEEIKKAREEMKDFPPEKITQENAPQTQSYDLPLSDAETRAREFAGRMYATGEELALALQGMAVESLIYLGETLGDVFTGSFGGLESFFKGILGIIGDFMSQFGQQLIALGVGKLALDTLFSNPVTAIAAGVALVALGGIVKSISAKGTSGIGTGGGTGRISSYSPPSSRSTFQGPGNAQSQEITWTIKGTDLVGVLRKQAYVAGR
ncbi:tape measure protein [Rufibacter soli]